MNIVQFKQEWAALTCGGSFLPISESCCDVNFPLKMAAVVQKHPEIIGSGGSCKMETSAQCIIIYHTNADLAYKLANCLLLQACGNSSSNLREGGNVYHCVCPELPQVCTGAESHAREEAEHLYPP